MDDRCAYCYDANCKGECMDAYENSNSCRSCFSVNRALTPLPVSAYYPHHAAEPVYVEPDVYEPF